MKEIKLFTVVLVAALLASAYAHDTEYMSGRAKDELVVYDTGSVFKNNSTFYHVRCSMENDGSFNHSVLFPSGGLFWTGTYGDGGFLIGRQEATISNDVQDPDTATPDSFETTWYFDIYTSGEYMKTMPIPLNPPQITYDEWTGLLCKDVSVGEN